jgi:hypothetical protein
MLPRARNNVQKLVMVLADGLSADRMLLYSEADSMKADGVEIVCIGKIKKEHVNFTDF